MQVQSKILKKTSSRHVLDIWGGGQILAFSGLDGNTDFASGLCGRTMHARTGIEMTSQGLCQIAICNEAPEQVTIGGDFFVIRSRRGVLKGAFIDAFHLIIDGDCDVLNASDEIAVMTSASKTLVCTKSAANVLYLEKSVDAIIERRRKWLDSQPLCSSAKLSQRSFTKALSIMKTQVYTPEGIIKHRWTTPDRWPHKGMWLWDSGFHAIGWRHIDVNLAREMVEAVFDVQKQDGMVPHMATPVSFTNITQPPVLGLAVRKIHESDPNIEWLKKMYPLLSRYVEWDLKNRTSPISKMAHWHIDNDPNCRSGESGMDNSPRFDISDELDAVDFNSFLASECETLAYIAGQIGLEAEEEKWKVQHDNLCELINMRHWNEQNGFYFDCISATGMQINVMAGAGFLPLLCGAATTEQVGALATHLQNKSTFGTLLPIPTIAVCDEKNYSKDMWRGPVWVNLNWLIAQGFERYGMHDIARHIRQRTCEEIERAYLKYGAFFEFYDDRCETDPPYLLRKKRNDPARSWVHQVIYDYGWTATLYVDMLCSERK